jgi:DNA (cytosine-5)-methyltransferase 1
MDIQQENDGGLRELALFAGAGGGILGGKLLGWRTVCAVEWDAYARDVLVARQNDGCLPAFPIWDDVCTFDGRPWRGRIDVISGGFPCQELSTQSAVYGNDHGLDGDKSGLWKEYHRILGEILPRYAFIENSPMLVIRGLDRVLCDLASLGYHARWGVIGANACGLDHLRKRVWIVAYRDGFGLEGRNNVDKKGSWKSENGSVEGLCKMPIRYDIPAPDAFGAANGISCMVDRLRCVGNGQVPAVAALAWEVLSRSK